MHTCTDPSLVFRYGSLLLAAVFVVAGCDGMSGSPPTFSDLDFKSNGRWQRETVQFEGENRRFKYYVPPTLSENAPAMMYLHGANIGMNLAFQEASLSGDAAEWVEIANEEGALLLVPDGSHIDQPVWNDCTHLPNRGNPNDTGFLTRLTDWATNKAEADADSVFVYGVSNGGQMANRLAIEHPDRYAAFAALISNINANLGDGEECPMPSDPIPALVVSGRNDPTTPFEGGFSQDWEATLLSAHETRDFWVENNIQGDPPPQQPLAYTEDISFASCTVTPAPQTGADVQLCAFDGGHTIPSGQFESARVSWRFFRQHEPAVSSK